MKACSAVLAALLLTAGAQARAQDAGHEHAEPASAAEEHDGHAPAFTPVPEPTDEDRVAARAPTTGHGFHDDAIHGYLLLDRLEARRGDGASGFGWEAKGWIGTDLRRLWLRSEGARHDGHAEAGDVEVLYGQSVSAWWDVVAGLRHDFTPGGGQTFAALGIQGLAPQRFDVSATGYLGEDGQSALRLDVERELLLTNRWIAQPVFEATAFGQDDIRRGIGSGLARMEAGLRVRYEFTRRFAPYLGVSYERTFGETADLRRAAGDGAGELRYMAGLRTWF